MSFCKFSPSYQSKNQTLVDNLFITDFLPKAPDLCVKAYLLGLCKCGQADDNENTMDFFAKTLNVCEEDVVSLFKYWEDMGYDTTGYTPASIETLTNAVASAEKLLEDGTSRQENYNYRFSIYHTGKTAGG